MGYNLLRKQGELPKLVGHRGACDVAPENTMASFKRAYQDGADIVEMDVRLTRMGMLWSSMMRCGPHDRRHGFCFADDFAELKRLDAGPGLIQPSPVNAYLCWMRCWSGQRARLV